MNMLICIARLTVLTSLNAHHHVKTLMWKDTKGKDQHTNRVLLPTLHSSQCTLRGQCSFFLSLHTNETNLYQKHTVGSQFSHRGHSQPPQNIIDSDRGYETPIKTLIHCETHKSSHATWNLAASASTLSFSRSSFFPWTVDVEYHEKQGSRVTEDLLEALTKRMGLHYCNEATGMAATLPSFTPSQPAPAPGDTLFPL